MLKNNEEAAPVSLQVIKRLPFYLKYLTQAEREGTDSISAAQVARDLSLNEVQVRKDLAAVSVSGGKPRVGYDIHPLIADIENFLGVKNTNEAVLVGVGHLGKALLSYDGFASQGLKIVAAFDNNEVLEGVEVHGKMVFPLYKLANLTQRLRVSIGIITVPAEAAQQVADLLVEGGVAAIWNFAPVRLSVPAGVMVQNENMASSLALLSQHLRNNPR